MEALLAFDSAAAGRRLGAMPETERMEVMDCFIGRLRNQRLEERHHVAEFADLVRKQLPTAQQVAVLFRGAPYSLVLEEYPVFTAYLEKIEATPGERMSCTEKFAGVGINWISQHRKVNRQDIDAVRGWFREISPDSVDSCTGRVLTEAMSNRVTSIGISVMILEVAAAVGWRIDARLADTRAEENVLAAEAARLKVGTGDTHPARKIRPSRAEREQEAKQLAVAYIALPKARQRIVINSVEYATAVERQIAALDTSRLKIFLADVLAAMELDGTIVAERVNRLLTNLARNDPRGALDLFTKHASICRKDLNCNVVSTALGAWAKDDPIAAAAWMKENAGEFPEAVSAQSLSNVMHPAAEKDPRLAFTFIASLGLNASHTFSALNDIVTAAATDEQRHTTLAALREYRDAHKDDKEARQAAD